jgi:hypothetical protein
MISKSVKEAVQNYTTAMSDAKWTFLRTLRCLDEKSTLSKAENEYALSRLHPNHITTKRSLDISKYSIGASFRVSLVNYILEKKSYKKFSIAPAQNDKILDSIFVSSLGHPVPKVINKSASASEAFEHKGFIVKATSGAASKGVFLNKGGLLYHFFDKNYYSKSDFFNYCAEQKMNTFIVEEYVGEENGVTDLKFYMFYGKVGVVLEVQRGLKGSTHCFYNENSEVINTGRYRETSFEGSGFSDGAKECAINIGENIPSPFVRVDLIVKEGKFWVGEITAHPGGFEDFNKEWDFRLGKEFIEARARLSEDLLSGKDFSSYTGRSLA